MTPSAFRDLVGNDRYIINRVVFRPDGCIAWVGPLNKHGYGRAIPHRAYGNDIHRYILSLKVQRCLGPDEFACHHCDVPCCVNPEHLYVGDAQTNVVDRGKRGRQAVGVAHGSAKLADNDIRQIRRLLAGGVSQRTIAVMFDISHTTVGNIKRGEIWSHVE